ncbi:hypothetical protein [Niveibacterium sp. SC-1]|uniref:hypothetical protein n=1 Tax=Niveibacterium sp. SC-1 TaxID=3135646 RepID=UPI00311E9FA5
MSEFGRSTFPAQISGLAREIQCKLIALGIDWQDGSQMRRLAQAILSGKDDFGGSDDFSRRAMRELMGLVSLMNFSMAKAANRDVDVHGGACWKALASALWTESGQ